MLTFELPGRFTVEVFRETSFFALHRVDRTPRDGTGFSLHLGVYPDRDFVESVVDGSMEKDEEGEFVYKTGRWVWGDGWERYDWCIRYFGAGPLFLYMR